MEIFSILLFLTFSILSLIHFNWVLGGKWGFDKSLPTNEKGKRVLNPGPFESAVVGFGLMSFGLFYLLQSGLIAVQLPSWLVDYTGWIIPAIFMLRAIGDFRYIGFFKKIKETDFGKMDSKIFAPLCLLIALMGSWIQIAS